MASKKKWSDLTDGQKKGIGVAGAVEAVLTAAALYDLARRPAGQIRGRKSVWVLAFSVQPFGPLAYFAMGRR